jgi:hypothetical protein
MVQGVFDPLQRQCFVYLLICLIIVLGRRKVHIANVWRAVRIAFVNYSLPASFKKMKKLPISFHIFETRGQKLATEGLDKLKGRPK